MKVTAIGPNGINDATFHIHAADCADLHKARYRAPYVDNPWTVEVSSLQELVETTHDDFIGTDETYTDTHGFTTWEDYVNDLRIFPCVKFPSPQQDSE